MAKTSFVKANAAEKPATATVVETASVGPAIPGTEIALRGDRQLAIPDAPRFNPSIQGEFDSSDIGFPYLSLANKTGELGENFPPGSFVLNKKVALSDGNVAFAITVLNVRKRYIEDIEFGSDERPQIFDKKTEVHAYGGTLEYGEKGYFKPMADIKVLISKPADEDDDSEFPLVGPDGLDYAIALWSLKGGAYTTAAKPIFAAALSPKLALGLHLTSFFLTSTRKQKDKNIWFTPIAKQGKMHAEDFAAFAAEYV